MNLLNKEFIASIKQITEEKGIPKKVIRETLEAALAAAYRKDYAEKGDRIKVNLNMKKGTVKVFKVFRIVPDETDEEDMNDKRDIKEKASKKLLKKDKKVKYVETDQVDFQEEPVGAMEAEEEKKAIKILGYLHIPQPSPEQGFGRIAAQTAKQVIMQRLREAERDTIFDFFKDKEGSMINGIIQRKEGRTVFVDLGQASGILPFEKQIPQEDYNMGARIKVYIDKVEKTSRGPEIILSRTDQGMIKTLFELEVPEIASGKVEIISIAREAGSRSKMAVKSKEKNLDPIGACIGQKGARVLAVISELGGEKIDIIEYSKDAKKYITHALAPAKVKEVRIIDKEQKQAVALVDEDQLSLAIGRNGQNVRLAAHLTGWRVDVKGFGKEDKKDEQAEKTEAESKKGGKKKGAKKDKKMKKGEKKEKKKKTKKN